MSKKKLSKLLALYLPYVVIGLLATNLGEAWRLAVGKELGDKIVSLMDTLPAAFSNPLPSLHLFDLFIGLCCGAGMRLAVYLKGKNAKKYRHGMEYGSARWGTPKDIEPFMAPKFADNIILTKTERLMMSNRPPDPKNARNKNVLVVGGSGSGKTRFFIKPNLLQCDSKNFPVSFVVTDPKGSIGVECGEALLKHGYKLKFFNTINFSKSMRYNPMSAFSSCSILFSGTTQVSGQTIYTAEDRDIRGAETDYKKLEKELDKKIKRTPTDHPGYDEYRYHLDAIEHDPWQLTSFLTTLYDDYTRSEVQAKLKETFAKQYKLTTWVEVQTRYRTVVMIDIFTGIPYTVQVPYEYRIFHTKLVNKGLEVVIREELDNDQWKRYEIFQDTLGGRPYLFKGGLPPGGSDGSGAPGIDYQVPAEALTNSEFAAIYKEAQKYVGTPYVWGGSTPETGFDCSGYVCWVYNQNGYNVGRTTANGLWNKSQHISEAEAKPGDLVFFEGTYDTPGKSHVGIYLGNGMMVSAGDPIKYANIHSSYWQKYLSGFGRLSK